MEIRVSFRPRGGGTDEVLVNGRPAGTVSHAPAVSIYDPEKDPLDGSTMLRIARAYHGSAWHGTPDGERRRAVEEAVSRQWRRALSMSRW